LAVIDIAIELTKYGKKNRRKFSGIGRVIQIPEFLYELQDDGKMVALGSPESLKLEKVKEKILEALDKTKWQTTRQVRDSLDFSPSLDQVTKALEELAREGKADRDPPISEGKRRGATYQWRLARSKEVDDDIPF